MVEHFDSFDEIFEPNPSGRTQTDGPTISSDFKFTRLNKDLVESVIKDILMGEHPENLPNYFEGNKYLQHHIGVGDGLDTLMIQMKKFALEGKISKYKKIIHNLGEGNFVLAVCEGVQGENNILFYDLFRIENNII